LTKKRIHALKERSAQTKEHYCSNAKTAYCPFDAAGGGPPLALEGFLCFVQRQIASEEKPARRHGGRHNRQTEKQHYIIYTRFK
jgi:hypothetical protein